MVSRKWIALVALFFTMFQFSCAEKLDDQDRTKPNIINKGMFTGEWYVRELVTDVPASSLAGIVGGINREMDRVRWEIQEGMLIGWRTYEYVEGWNDTLTEKEQAEKGIKKPLTEAVAIRIPITGHFDVRRSYNAQTGEETNIITEDASSRKWFERTHFRLNWAGRTVESGSAGANWHSDKTTKSETSPYFIEVGKDHINVQLKELWSPNYNYSCYLWWFTPDCNKDTPATVLLSMKRVDPNNTYMAKEYPSYIVKKAKGKPVVDTEDPDKYDRTDVLDRYGFFFTGRTSWDEVNGSRMSSRKYFANRFDIWERSYDKQVDNGKAVKTGEYTCSCPSTGGFANIAYKCSKLAQNSQLVCERPFVNRVIKPIVYYLNDDFVKELEPAMFRVGEQWNRAYRKALADVAQTESFNIDSICSSSNLDAAYKNGRCVNGKIRPFMVCSNPVTKNSPYICQTNGGRENPWFGMRKFGDLRFNHIVLARPNSAIGPLGYGPGSHDPLTGETVGAWSVTYKKALDNASKFAADVVKLLNKEVEPTDLNWSTGDYHAGIKSSFNAAMKGKVNTVSWGERFNTNEGNLNKISDHKFKADDHGHDHIGHKHNFDGLPRLEKTYEEMFHETMDKIDPSLIKNLQKDIKRISHNAKQVEVPKQFLHELYKNMDKEVLRIFAPNQDVTNPFGFEKFQEMIAKDPSKLKDYVSLKEDRERWYSQKNMLMADFVDPTIQHLAKRFADNYPIGKKDYGSIYCGKYIDEKLCPAQKANLTDKIQNTYRDKLIWKEIRDAIYIAVMLHEVGHNVGLTHNFAASTDELNYIQPGENTIALAKDDKEREGTWLVNTELDKVGKDPKGYWSILSGAPGNDATQKSLGRMEYQYSSVMDYGGKITSDLHGLGSYDIAAIRFGYLGYIEAFKSGHPYLDQNCKSGRKCYTYREAIRNIRNPQGNKAFIDNVRKLNKDRIYIPFEPNNISKSHDDSNGNDNFNAEKVTYKGKTYWVNRHKFCWDIYAQGTSLYCYRWDEGRDSEEVATNLLDYYNNYYWFDNFRLGRMSWGGPLNRVMSRYMQFGMNASKIYAFYGDSFAGAQISQLLKEDMLYGVFDGAQGSQYSLKEKKNILRFYDTVRAYAVPAIFTLNSIANTLHNPRTALFQDRYQYKFDRDYDDKKDVLQRGYCDKDIKNPSQSNRGCFNFEVEDEVAHPLFPKYDEDIIYYVNHSGYLYNQYAALFVLGDTMNIFDRQAFVSQRFTLSLVSSFPAEVFDFMTPIFTGEHSDYWFPTFDANDKAITKAAFQSKIDNKQAINMTLKPKFADKVKWDFLIASQRPVSQKEIDIYNQLGTSVRLKPYYSFNIRYQAIVMLIMGVYNQMDPSGIDLLRVSRKGDVTDGCMGAPAGCVEFIDPYTKVSWTARKKPDVQTMTGKTIDPSLGYRVLKRAKEITEKLDKGGLSPQQTNLLRSNLSYLRTNINMLYSWSRTIYAAFNY